MISTIPQKSIAYQGLIRKVNTPVVLDLLRRQALSRVPSLPRAEGSTAAQFR